MSITSWAVGIWDSTSQSQVRIPSLPRIAIPPKSEEIETHVRFLKAELIHYLKNYRGYYDSLNIELPSINSGGRGGSIFSATKLWNRIYLGIERKNDRSADTVSIRWIQLNATDFQKLLENSLRKMLTEDVPLLKHRAHLRNDFWKTVNGGINN